MKKHQDVVEKQIDQGNVIEEKSYNVPDRVAGREAVKELSRDRQWNFIEVCICCYRSYLFSLN